MGTLSHTKKQIMGTSFPLPLWSCDKSNMQRQLVGIYEFIARV